VQPLNQWISHDLSPSLSLAEDSGLLECHVLPLDKWFPVFQRIVVPSSAGSRSPRRVKGNAETTLLGLLDHEHKDSTII